MNNIYEHGHPFKKFAEWFSKADAHPDVKEAIATTLATSTRSGRPSARVLFVKIFDEKGFYFFTNYESKKSRELSENPQASLCYYWQPLGLQIRIEGRVEKTSAAESDAYFKARHLESRVASSLSRQSRPLDSFEKFHDEIKRVTAASDDTYPRPQSWGGWRLIPDYFEFWQAGEFRIHQREIFKLQPDGKWLSENLYP